MLSLRKEVEELEHLVKGAEDKPANDEAQRGSNIMLIDENDLRSSRV